MAGKDRFNKAAWLVKVIEWGMKKRGGLTLEEIQRQAEEDMGTPLLRRTFFRWKEAAEELIGAIIDCDPHNGYRYHITNLGELGEYGLPSWLLDNMATNNLLLSYQSLKGRILVPNALGGGEHLPRILNAMKRGLVIRVTYQSFKNDTPNVYNFAPYGVRLFKQRWYTFGRDPDKESDSTVWLYPLDRILDIETVQPERPFEMPADFDPAEHFRHCYGVFDGGCVDPETVVLRATPTMARYLETLPLHHSQRETERTDTHSIFQLRLCPTSPDFLIELLSHAPDIEVLSPPSLRQKMAEIARKTLERHEQVTQGVALR